MLRQALFAPSEGLHLLKLSLYEIWLAFLSAQEVNSALSERGIYDDTMMYDQLNEHWVQFSEVSFSVAAVQLWPEMHG